MSKEGDTEVSGLVGGDFLRIQFRNLVMCQPCPSDFYHDVRDGFVRMCSGEGPVYVLGSYHPLCIL